MSNGMRNKKSVTEMAERKLARRIRSEAMDVRDHFINEVGPALFVRFDQIAAALPEGGEAEGLDIRLLDAGEFAESYVEAVMEANGLALPAGR